MTGPGVHTGAGGIHTHRKQPASRIAWCEFHNSSQSGKITEQFGKSNWLGHHTKSRSIHLQPSPLSMLQGVMWILEAPESCPEKRLSQGRYWRVHACPPYPCLVLQILYFRTRTQVAKRERERERDFPMPYPQNQKSKLLCFGLPALQ